VTCIARLLTGFSDSTGQQTAGPEQGPQQKNSQLYVLIILLFSFHAGALPAHLKRQKTGTLPVLKMAAKVSGLMSDKDG